MEVSKGNKVYHSVGNCLIETSEKKLIAGCNSSVIPTDGSVTYIEDGAFSSCSGLISITIPDSVKSIGAEAFQGCSSLTSVNIPDSVTVIESGAFENCLNLKTITIGTGVTQIGDYAFANCLTITVIIIPKNVTVVGNNVFLGCTGISIYIEITDIPSGWSSNWIENDKSDIITGDKWEHDKDNSEMINVFGDWKVTKYPTCTEEGVETRVCVNDASKIQTRTIDKLPHTEVTVEGQAATCIAHGYTDGKKCSVCGETLVRQEVIPLKQHTYENGICKVCGAEQPSSEHQHKETVIPSIAATCTEPGLTSGKKCLYCGEIIVEQRVIPAKGHTDDVTLHGTAATCTQSGLTDGKKCSVCGEITVAQTAIPAKGHTEMTVKGQKATCTSPGLTDGINCSVCNAVILKQNNIPPIGHTFENGVCKICGAKPSDSEHTHTEAVVPGKDATCTEAGLTDGKKCSSCGMVIVEQTIIPAKGHAELIISGTEATCTYSGLTDGKKCSVCNTVILEQQVIPAKGHSYVDGVCTVCNYKKPSTLSYTPNSDGKSYSVTKVEEYYDKEVIIPDTYDGKPVTAIDNGAFEGCKSIESVKFPKSITKIGDNAFKDCENLTEIDIPDSVTSIGNEAFDNCSKLEKVTIGKGVTQIGNRAFANCFHIIIIIIPENVKILGVNVFVGCNEIIILIEAEIIPEGWSAGWNGNDNSDIKTGGNWEYDKDNSDTINIFEDWKVTKAPTCSAEGIETRVCINDPSKTQTRPVSKLPHNEIAVEGKAETCTEAGLTDGKKCSVCGTATVAQTVIPAKGHSYENGVCKDCGKLNASEGLTFQLNADQKSYYVYKIGSCNDSDIIIPETYNGKPVTGIGNSAFGNRSITSITIPDSITSIGSGAFSGCGDLTSITIGKGLSNIGSQAFAECYSIEKIEVSKDNSVYKSVGNCLIEISSKKLILGCQNSEIPADGSVTSIGDNAFYGCFYLNGITIPDSITSIGNSAFRNCNRLTNAAIPGSVTSIGDNAFNNCSYLTSITIPDSVKSIGVGAFQFCTNLANVTLPSTLTSISNGLFYDCGNLKSITIPENVTSIGNNAFYRCGLTSITLPDSVTSIGSGAFDCCVSLTGIIIPDNVTSIGDRAFTACIGFTSITIPDRVTRIGTYAFQECSNLKSITIGSGVKAIEFCAFLRCSSLETIKFNGTTAQWDEITKEVSWDLGTADYTIQCTDGTISK